jgi:5-methylcytosine-specific restriction protein A
VPYPGIPLGTRWRSTRTRILTRDGYQCTRVLKGSRCTNTATEVDHIHPRSLGGTDDDSNLASLCHAHHAEKTKRESAAARWKHRSTREPEPHPGIVR